MLHTIVRCPCTSHYNSSWSVTKTQTYTNWIIMYFARIVEKYWLVNNDMSIWAFSQIAYFHTLFVSIHYCIAMGCEVCPHVIRRLFTHKLVPESYKANQWSFLIARRSFYSQSCICYFQNSLKHPILHIQFSHVTTKETNQTYHMISLIESQIGTKEININNNAKSQKKTAEKENHKNMLLEFLHCKLGL